MRFKEYLTENESDVNQFLQANGLRPHEYVINNGVVDVKRNVFIDRDTLHNGKLPIQFGTVEGAFDICDCNVISLKGCPSVVKGIFTCAYNEKLTSLIGGPKTVFTTYNASNTAITSLEGVAEIKPDSNSLVKMDLQLCRKLTSIEQLVDMPSGLTACIMGMHMKSLVGISDIFAKSPNLIHTFDTEHVTEGGIGLVMLGPDCRLGQSYSSYANNEPFKIIEKYMGRPDDIFECQAELIEAGYAEYAKL